MTFTQDTAKKVKKLRELKGYTQEYMATELEVSTRQYQRIESGEIDLTLGKIEQIAKLLELSPVQVMGFDDKLIFEQCTNTGIGKVTFNQPPKDVLALHEDQIIQLREEIAFLREFILKTK
jgi:transcriptional regulator with XRE-family HTH domain